ncbi:sugar phosphate isomerase/epimerase family protein [Romboutsia sp.]|uniref:sugar phosphate isomerase/epimerase family protein n=1 Tax=Romboutsia sp. TaxID=1965302 RepID=UPI003F34ACA9
MEIYISQLDESKKVVPIVKEYNVGLEVVQFASPYILDNLEECISSYKNEIKEILGSTSLSIHGPYADLIPGTRDKMIAKVAKERFEQGYKVAKELGAKKIVYHNSYTPKTYTNIEWMNNSIKFWKDFTKDKLEDIEIHIENTLEDDYELIKNLVEEINHPNFSICLDIGHINAYSYLTLEQWMSGLGDKIKHMHIHNNYGEKDTHSGIQNGNMNIIELLNYVKENMENTSISLEIVDINQLKESLELLREYNFRLFQEIK